MKGVFSEIHMLPRDAQHKAEVARFIHHFGEAQIDMTIAFSLASFVPQ